MLIIMERECIDGKSKEIIDVGEWLLDFFWS